MPFDGLRGSSANSGFDGWPEIIRQGAEARARRSDPCNAALDALSRAQMHIDSLKRASQPPLVPYGSSAGFAERAIDALEDAQDAALSAAVEALAEYRRVRRAAIATPATGARP